jgi:pyruvate dehydrogenase E2 component (dihydrolipoamide acetyltransferase)
MAKEILLPKQGNSVESCIIVEWSKNIGDQVNTGDLICQVETDKAVVDVESPADGILLKTFFEVDDEVPVHTLIALLGDKGEDISSYESAGQPSTSQNSAEEPVETVKKEAPKKETQKDNMPSSTAQTESSGSPDGISRGGTSRGGTSGGLSLPGQRIWQPVRVLIPLPWWEADLRAALLNGMWKRPWRASSP